MKRMLLMVELSLRTESAQWIGLHLASIPSSGAMHSFYPCGLPTVAQWVLDFL